eukprot:TRINITY_DN203_c0_g1_i2.p2 TRINITY_DN203_c0_g1~~TRINITY_DN203_c0_g1_i2.p2  ORF type:complete len:133 (+),score=8.61 TRINITY_DN203_c0_g1_i2:380-778(+)
MPPDGARRSPPGELWLRVGRLLGVRCEPVEALEETIAGRRTRALDVPAVGTDDTQHAVANEDDGVAAGKSCAFLVEQYADQTISPQIMCTQKNDKAFEDPQDNNGTPHTYQGMWFGDFTAFIHSKSTSHKNI